MSVKQSACQSPACSALHSVMDKQSISSVWKHRDTLTPHGYETTEFVTMKLCMIDTHLQSMITIRPLGVASNVKCSLL